MPACEIGGLRAAEVNATLGITLRMRYQALDTVMKTAELQAQRSGFQTAFLTCTSSVPMQKLYKDHYGLLALGDVCYGTEQLWKALWRRVVV